MAEAAPAADFKRTHNMIVAAPHNFCYGASFKLRLGFFLPRRTARDPIPPRQKLVKKAENRKDNRRARSSDPGAAGERPGH
jgi:hypothetical protein